MLSAIPHQKANSMSQEDIDREILRLGIIAELDAVSLYEQLAHETKNPLISKTLLDIAKEEKTHAGEFQELLIREDTEQKQELVEGKKEVEKLSRRCRGCGEVNENCGCYENPIVREKKPGHLTITCEFCGEPLDVMIPDFGMDCKNKCSYKRWQKSGMAGKSEKEIMETMFGKELFAKFTQNPCENPNGLKLGGE